MSASKSEGLGETLLDEFRVQGLKGLGNYDDLTPANPTPKCLQIRLSWLDFRF